MFSSDTTYLIFIWKILLGRCWVCMQTWISPPPYRGTRYHLREYGTRPPQNARELFNLRHSSLRVTVEMAFGALKNIFKILYNKPFHPYPTQVKLVLACCILHNWIIRHGFDEHVPNEATWEPNPSNEAIPNDQMMDNATWAAKRDAYCAEMLATRGCYRNWILFLLLVVVVFSNEV